MVRYPLILYDKISINSKCDHFWRQVLQVPRDNFGGEKIPTAEQRCNALSTWLQCCSGAVTENTVDTILLLRFRGMRDAVRNILKANK